MMDINKTTIIITFIFYQVFSKSEKMLDEKFLSEEFLQSIKNITKNHKAIFIMFTFSEKIGWGHVICLALSKISLIGVFCTKNPIVRMARHGTLIVKERSVLMGK